MKLRPSFVAFLLLVVGTSVAFGQPGDREKKPKPDPPGKPSAPSAPNDETNPDTTTGGTPSTPTYPPPSTESSSGKFTLKCTLSHQRQVDPIVTPGPKGTPSGHVHDFFGNRSTDSDSTYASMTSATTTCGLSADTAGYWTPSLVRPDGGLVKPVALYPVYKNVPIKYGTTVPFPADFRMIAGGDGTYPNFWWNCGADSSETTRLATPPTCGSDRLIANLQFPNCWDGVRTDAPDHRSHVVYSVDNKKCPETHPVKLPRLSLKLYYPKGESGPGYRLADGGYSLHADFWNTWQQSKLEQLVRDCLNAGVDCGRVQG